MTDLVSFAASRGLLDEAAARRMLGEAPATAARLLELGVLHADDLDPLLDAYHRELGATMRLGEAAPAKCGRCGGRMGRQGDDVVCEPCGIRVTLGSSPLGRLPPEAAEAMKDPTRRVGRYVKLRELGQGGFGVVWLAWDAQLSRNVALKFLGGQTPDDRARFRREASLAGTLSHPNIAAVYEVGDEPPYIAMQYIEGMGADKLKPSVPEALRVVKAAADAVQHAHEQGIIHRDLKPQNIMIDKSGRVFVMDFGLAKRTDVESTLSQSGVIAGTPSYMSPEQAEGHVHIDGRTDVYSLGATLYALVAGVAPFTGPAVEILRRVIAEEPSTLRADPDVRTIAAKAMEKDPTRRYRTAAELAEDIGRYLGGEPIAARPASMAYRIKKRILKHVALSTAMAAAVVIAIGAATTITIGAVKRSRERDWEADRQRRTLESSELCRAAMEDVKAGKELWRVKVSKREQWEKLFASAEAKARQAIERYPDLPGGPYTLGEIEQARGAWKKAAREFDRAIELAPHMANAWYRRGVCELEMYDAALLMPLSNGESFEGRIRELEPRKKRALECLNRYTQLSGTVGAEDPESRMVEARFVYASGRPDDALKICDELLTHVQTDDAVWLLKAKALSRLNRWTEVVSTLQNLTGEVTPQHPEAWYQLGRGRDEIGDNRGAIDDFTKAIGLRPAFASAYADRGSAKMELGDYHGAVEDCTKAIELEPDLAEAFVNRGTAEGKLGNWRRMVEDCTRAIKVRPNLAEAYDNRGNAKGKLGDYRGEIEDCTKAIELKPDYAKAYVNRGNARENLGDHRGAIEDCSKTIELDPKSAEAYCCRGGAKGSLGDFLGAIEDYSKAIGLKPTYATAYVNRGGAKGDQGDWQGMLADCTKALELEPENALVLYNCGVAKGELGDLQGAIEDYSKAIGFKPDFIEAHHNRGVTKMKLGDPRGAIADLSKVIELKPDHTTAHWGRGMAKQGLDDFNGALDDFIKSLELNPGLKTEVESRISECRKRLAENGTDY